MPPHPQGRVLASTSTSITVAKTGTSIRALAGPLTYHHNHNTFPTREARSRMVQDTCKGGATSGATVICIHKIPCRAPNHMKKNKLSSETTRKGATKFHGSKGCRNRSVYLGPARCAYRGQRRSRTWQSHRAAPQASPLVYTAREKDPRQGLRCLRRGPSRAPYSGPPILSGAPTLSPALPLPSSRGNVTIAALVKPRAKRTHVPCQARAEKREPPVWPLAVPHSSWWAALPVATAGSASVVVPASTATGVRCLLVPGEEAPRKSAMGATCSRLLAVAATA